MTNQDVPDSGRGGTGIAPSLTEIARPSAGHRIESLTGLRILAAWMVYLHHRPLSWLRLGGLDPQAELHIGVSVFYVLSGFLISYRYDHGERTTKRWLAEYWWARISRIYPVYLLLVVLTLILQGSTNVGEWALNLTLLKGFFDDYKFSGIAQSWSLTVEECFYACAPLLFFLGRGQRLLWRAAAFGLAACVAAMLVGEIASTRGFLSPPRFVLLYTFFGRSLDFIVGMQLARLLSAGVLPTRRPGWTSTALGSGGVLLVLLGLSALRTPESAYGLYHPLGIVLNNLVLPPFVALLLYGLIAETTWLRRLLGSRPMVLLGQASYSFYLIHVGVVRNALVSAGIAGQLSQFVAINAVSILVFLLFERPMQRVLRSLGWRLSWIRRP